MTKRLEFFNKETGQVLKNHPYFVYEDGSVWRDNYQTCESQCAVVGFDDFKMECPDVDWRPLP